MNHTTHVIRRLHPGLERKKGVGMTRSFLNFRRTINELIEQIKR
jgi:hypothetical protein